MGELQAKQQGSVYQGAGPRIDAVDCLRGLAVLVLSLDFTRSFFFNPRIDPTDPVTASSSLFFTRWAAHFCAPVLVFLTGTAAFLARSRGKTRRQLSWFLLSRGLWLVLLELTIVRLGWSFNLTYEYTICYLLGAIGWSMAAMALLVFLPPWLLLLFGLFMIGVHNLFDGIRADGVGELLQDGLKLVLPDATVDRLGSLDWIWTVLYSPGWVQPNADVYVQVYYPLVPWVGVMATGYGLGHILLLGPRRRRLVLAGLGALVCLAFFGLRYANRYGDPLRWWHLDTDYQTALFFLSCYEFPPSLLFLSMTLGSTLLLLALFDVLPAGLTRPLATFGRVPLFFYLLQIPLVHTLALWLAWAKYGEVGWMFEIFPNRRAPRDYGYELPVVYLVWLNVVLLLYPVCRWYAGVKERRRSRLWTYL
jgi:uncharacterized membrane protein